MGSPRTGSICDPAFNLTHCWFFSEHLMQKHSWLFCDPWIHPCCPGIAQRDPWAKQQKFTRLSRPERFLRRRVRVHAENREKMSNPLIPGVRQRPLHPGDPDYVSPESREDCIRKSLALRLKSVCQELSAADFDALIQQMTLEQLRGERTAPGEASAPGHPL